MLSVSTWSEGMVVLHSPNDPIDFSRGQTNELNGNVMGTTISASFKSLRATLIPAILPTQEQYFSSSFQWQMGAISTFSPAFPRMYVRVQAGDGYHICYFNRI